MDRLEELRQQLDRASTFMRDICEDLSDVELRTQYDEEFSPIGWHLGHVAWQEELWVLRTLARRAPLNPAFDEVFDSFRPNKSSRGVRIPDKRCLFEYRASVRAAVLDCLDQVLADDSGELMRGAGLLRFVANHESQHGETVLAIRLAADLPLGGNQVARPAGCQGTAASQFMAFSGGEFRMGTSDDPDRWDNECAGHSVRVLPFRMQRFPVSNQAWLEFLNAGGYEDERLWSPAGWRFIRTHAIEAPLYWRRDAEGAWRQRTLFGEQALELTSAVCHVSCHEADAFARFARARLPSEAEWEWACVQQDRSFEAAARVDALQGVVWQWTSDLFRPYPGFVPQAYDGYSVPWFDGQHRTLRGGSYATRPEIARPTFRNWYLPSMRRAFAGLRLVEDSG